VQCGTTRAALPLEAVARLETFRARAIETSDGRTMVQYREGILPLARFDHLPLDVFDPQAEIHAVVIAGDDGLRGIVVDAILDVVEVPLADLARRHTSPVADTVVIRDRITRYVELTVPPDARNEARNDNRDLDGRDLDQAVA